jgi:hypothetical protein
MISLQSVPVWGWAFVYLMIIPAFAFIYCVRSGNLFYQSAVQHEQAFHEGAGEVLARLCNSLIANSREANHGDTPWIMMVTELISQTYSLCSPTSVERISIRMSLSITKAT